MTYNLPCEQCTQTQHHCCKADVTLTLKDLTTIFKWLEGNQTDYNPDDFLAVKKAFKEDKIMLTKLALLWKENTNDGQTEVTE